MAVRFLSDASYWMYLVHLPLLLVGQALLRKINLPAIVKLTILLWVAAVVLLLSYRFVVRYTWIGRLLNGPGVRRSDDSELSPALNGTDAPAMG